MAAPAGSALDIYRQSGFDVRFDWGLQGAAAIAPGADVIVVVDVLSFTTTVSVAVDHGVEVFPYRLRDASAAAFAASRSAVLAVGRSERHEQEVSLSPLSVRAAACGDGVLVTTRRLVLPSPNGSAICRHFADGAWKVLGACFRNVSGVAAWIRRHAAGPVAVVAAGERWPGELLRPAVEDMWGAGALIDRLGTSLSRSPEAASARAAYLAVSKTLRSMLEGCGSGRELVLMGWGEEVPVAAELDTSRAVPLLDGERFRAA